MHDTIKRTLKKKKQHEKEATLLVTFFDQNNKRINVWSSG